MIGQRLKYLRQKRGLKQADIAEFLGVSRSTYTQYETGKSEPDLATVAKLAHFFHTSVDFLLSKTERRLPLNHCGGLLLPESGSQYQVEQKDRAKQLLNDIREMFARDDFTDVAQNQFFKAVTQIYFDAKEKAAD